MLIDDFLPEYDVLKRHTLALAAPPASVYPAVRKLDMRGSWPVRILFGLRSGSASGLGLTLDGLLKTGFVLLAENPPHELVLGLVGQFWKATGNIRRIQPGDFAAFNQPDYAKVVWNFTLAQTGDSTQLATETRVLCLDDASRRRFKRYWTFIGPFSGLIRAEMLRVVRQEVSANA